MAMNTASAVQMLLSRCLNTESGIRLLENGDKRKLWMVDLTSLIVIKGHVASYMNTLMEDEPDKYQSHFSRFIKKGVELENMEEMYKKVHAAIRADPTKKKSEIQPPKKHKRFAEDQSSGYCHTKISGYP